MNTLTPTCPYCGAKMYAQRVRREAFFRHYAAVCTRCHAQGPMVTGMGGEENMLARATERALRREIRESIRQGDGDAPRSK